MAVAVHCDIHLGSSQKDLNNVWKSNHTKSTTYAMQLCFDEKKEKNLAVTA